MLNVVMLGPPGAGKGTQAAQLRDHLGVPYLSTGDLLRRHRAKGTALGERAARYMDDGELVPDGLVISMLWDAVHGVPRGFVLDGFPRTVAQAEALDVKLADAGARLHAVVLVHVPDDVLVERISGRLTCPRGHVYHSTTSPPARPGVCDHDDERLRQRKDDRPDTVRRRLAVYHRSTKPLVAFYEEQKLLRLVDGTRAPAEVFESICGVLGVPAANPA